jgi:hypothetical protein
MSKTWDTIPGWWDHRCAATYRGFASEMESGIIIEVGSYAGRSAASIADVCRLKRNRLFCVDTFKGDPLYHLPGQKYALVPIDKLYGAFLSNMAEVGCLDIVTPIMMSSVDAAKMLAPYYKADLIMIDANHSYECVCQDIDAWRPILKPGGRMMGHDYGSPGVRRAVTEKLPEHTGKRMLWAWVKPKQEVVV